MLDPELSSRYWLVRKVCAIVGYYGGLRNIEMRSIEFGQTFEGGEKSFEVDQCGYWFSFERGKQRGLPETSVFCVPRRQSDWAPVASSDARSPVDFDPASVVDRYLHLLESDLQTTQDLLKGSFFKSTHGKHGKKFRNVPMGKNILAKVGSEFAEELLLPNPKCYTGHCWRRSCGTNTSDAGVNVTTLMAQLGWSTPKTAIGYVRKSRITSYQMSMFLSSCQRQNKDIDACLALVRPVAIQSDRTVSSSSRGRQKKSSVPLVSRKNLDKSLVKSIVPDFDAKLSDSFLRHLSAAKSKEFVPKNLEHKKLESDRKRVLDQIAGHVSPFCQSSVEVEEHELGDFGGGRGEDVFTGIAGGGEGGGNIRGSGVSADIGQPSETVDPRVSSILTNLRHQGDLHVHFHFGK